MRAFKTIATFLVICGALHGLQTITYLLGGFLESKIGDTVPGIHHVIAILTQMLVVVMVIATLLTLAERKWSAMMQDRIGPNRARIGLPVIKDWALAGLPHVATDVVKMLTKEAFRPAAASKFLFNLAPMLAFAPVFALFAIVPSGPTVSLWGKDIMMVSANPDFGLLYMFAIASLAVYGTSLAGWSSNNKFALLGGVRASSQMISYEVALGLSLVGMMMAFSTVKLAGNTGMANLQETMLWSGHIGSLEVGIQQWGILLQPVGFILFFAAAFAETKRAPFDTPEGESEIVGYFLEYSGMQFGMFMISEFVEVVILSGVLTAIFFGGWSVPFVSTSSIIAALPKFGDSAEGQALSTSIVAGLFGMVFWVKVILLCYLQLVIRWTYPRFRYDQIQTLGWQILLPMGLGNLFISGALILWDPSMRALALFGALELAIVAMLTVTPTRQARREAAEAEAHHGHGGGHGGGHGALDDGHHDDSAPELDSHAAPSH